MEFELKSATIHDLVDAEVKHAMEKHCNGRPAGRDPFTRILTEEVGEVAKVINKRQAPSKLRDEIVQVMAVCQLYLMGSLRDSDL